MGIPEWDNDPRLQAYLDDWREYGPISPPRRERPARPAPRLTYQHFVGAVALIVFLLIVIALGGFR